MDRDDVRIGMDVFGRWGTNPTVVRRGVVKSIHETEIRIVFDPYQELTAKPEHLAQASDIEAIEAMILKTIAEDLRASVKRNTEGVDVTLSKSKALRALILAVLEEVGP